MPSYVSILGYKIYFWSNENGEPVHFHVSKGKQSQNATKIWLLSNGSLSLCHNKSRIPTKDLSIIMAIMQNEYNGFCRFWQMHLGYINFYK